jgi:formylglycine-generating enzyme required for sulfatase activity
VRLRLLLPILLCCGGHISDFPPPDPNAVPYDDRIGPLLQVPGGETDIGFWEGVWQVGTYRDLTPIGCALDPNGTDGSIVTDDHPVSVTVSVETFGLMATEVSNRAYGLCVDDGGCQAPDFALEDAQGNPIDWRSPSIAEHPVLVSWELAYAFCRHYGGDLPTAGEFSRAASGDAMAYSVPAMIDEWRACAEGSADPECARFQFYGDWVDLLDVGTDATDVGPYGHRDLFTNAAEWMRGEPVIRPATSCTTFAEHDLALEDHPWYGNSAYFPMLGAYSSFDQIAPQLPESSQYPRAYTGFRCAFPAN